MLFVSPRFFQSRISGLAFLVAGVMTLIALAPIDSRAQRVRTPAEEPEDRPAFSEFRGVRIGMPADEARKKLGSPRTKGDEEDFYVFNDTQAVQVLYDKARAVTAISIDFMNGANAVPTPKEVLGTEADTKPDGSLYKMLRYPKAGYWISYSRTAGKEPTTTIIMQKIGN
jgi:hypothetical protein